MPAISDQNTIRMIPQHTRTLIRREYRAALNTAETERIFARYARKYGVSARVIKLIAEYKSP